MLNQSVDCLQTYSLFMGDTICFTGWLLLPTRCGIPTVALRLQNFHGIFHGRFCAATHDDSPWRTWGLHTSEIMRCWPLMGTCEIHSWESASKEGGRRKAERFEMAMRSGWDEECPVCSISVAVQNFTWTLFHYWFFLERFLMIPWLPCFVSIFLCCFGVCHWFHSLGHIPV